MRSEHGQAAIEWTGLVLLVALALGALPLAGLHVDGRSLGGFLAHRIVCAAKLGCDGGGAAPRAASSSPAASSRPTWFAATAIAPSRARMEGGTPHSSAPTPPTSPTSMASA